MNWIVGLGNPGEKYLLTPHNIAWLVLDTWAYNFNSSLTVKVEKTKKQKKFSFLKPQKNKTLTNTNKLTFDSKKKVLSQVARLESQNLILAKPLTYMNLSGQAVKALMNYYHLEQDKLLVIQDDIDLKFLSLKFQKNRGPAGHNGLKSINQELGSQNYSRLRIGMAMYSEPNTPTNDSSQNPKGMPSRRDVLKPFTKAELELLPVFLEKAIEAIKYYLQEGLEKAANRYN